MGTWSKHVMGNDMAMDFFDGLSSRKTVNSVAKALTDGIGAVSALLVAGATAEQRDPEAIDRDVREFMTNYKRVNTHLKLTEAYLREKESDYRRILLDSNEETPENAIQTTMAACFLVAWGKSLVVWKTADQGLNRRVVEAAIAKEHLASAAANALASLLDPVDTRVELFSTQAGQCKRLRKKLLANSSG